MKFAEEILNSLGGGIIATGADGRITGVNPAAEHMTGYRAGEMEGNFPETLFQVFDTRTGEKYQDLAARVMEQGSTLQIDDATMVSGEGRSFPVCGSIALVKDPGGVVLGTVMVFHRLPDLGEAERRMQEITEKKRIELLLRQWADAFEHCSHGIAMGMPGSNRILTCNPAFARLQGRTIEEIASMGILQMYTPEDHEHVIKHIAEADQKGSARYEARMVRKDGSDYPVQMDVVSVKDENGNILYRIATQQDITERKRIQDQLSQNEASFRGLFKQNPVPMWVYDPETLAFLAVNHAAVAHYGYSREEFSTMTLNDIRTAADRAKLQESIKRRTDNYERSGPWRHLKKDGTLILVEIASHTITWQGRPAVIVVAFDQTVRIKAENELRNAREKAEESDRLKSHFLANISHEIRTPMNGILGFTNLLRTINPSGAEREKFFNIIQTSGERLMITINDLIEISSIQSGGVVLSEAEVNINELLRFHSDFFALQCRQKGLQFSCLLPLADENAIVITDKYKLDSILINLIRNAIKFTESGSVEFGYKLPEEYIEFFVTDTGRGIPADRLEAIFDRFVQADLQMTRAHEGSGLGLSISKAYVQMMGGTIRVESQPGAGSTFRFTIPWKSPGSRKSETPPPTAIIYDKLLQEKSVLIAEDDEINYVYLQNILEPLCRSFFRASSGKEAVDHCLSGNQTDLILMDIKMHDMDGYEATRKIREFDNRVIIIAQTAHAFKEEREKALRSGCNDYIAKPFSLDELMEVISRNFR